WRSRGDARSHAASPGSPRDLGTKCTAPRARRLHDLDAAAPMARALASAHHRAGVGGPAMSEPVPDVTPDLPGVGWRSTLALLRRLPQGALSRTFGRLADIPLPRMLRRP